jgi:hypothetical protein
MPTLEGELPKLATGWVRLMRLIGLYGHSSGRGGPAARGEDFRPRLSSRASIYLAIGSPGRWSSISNSRRLTRSAGFLCLVAEFVPANLVQPRQAVIPIQIFDECPHDRNHRLPTKQS